MSDRQQDGFHEKVKKVFEEWSPQSKGWGIPIGARCRRETQEYDQQGRLTVQVLYPGMCGSEEIYSYYSYDKDGNRLEKEDSSGASTLSTAGTARSQSDHITFKHVFKYDSRGRKIEASVYGASGKLAYRMVYKYDALDRYLGLDSFDADCKGTGGNVIQYSNTSKFPVSSTNTNSDGKPRSKTFYSAYKANSVGDWISRKEVNQRLDQPEQANTVALVRRKIDYY